MQGKIRKLHNMLLSGSITATGITEKYFEYIEKINPQIKGYVSLTKKAATDMAQKVDRDIKQGKEISMLAGIPYALKDNISTKGERTSCCSKMLYNYVPVYDAFVYEKLKNAGAVMLGKANMDEFSMGSTCENSCYGATKNPLNIERVPGGSSGGSSAVVAADMAVFSLGSDTGGSVRQPASFCGQVGLKPTYGAVSRYGLIAYASSLDQVGIIAGSVEDVAVVFDEISACDEKDSTCSCCDRKSSAKELKNGIKGIKIGIIKNLFKGLNEEINEGLMNATEVYRSLGAEIVEVDIPSVELALPAYYIIACGEAASNLARYDGIRYGHRTDKYTDRIDMVTKSRSEGFGYEVKKRIIMGNYVLTEGKEINYYNKAQMVRKRISEEFARAFESVDILFSPTAFSTAFKLGEKHDNPTDVYMSDLCTVAANICGLPAISVPCGFDKNGLPIGMQLIGDKFMENRLLNLAYKYEEMCSDIIYKKPMAGGECIEL